jgi:hypothetical protein
MKCHKEKVIEKIPVPDFKGRENGQEFTQKYKNSAQYCGGDLGFVHTSRYHIQTTRKLKKSVPLKCAAGGRG